MIKIRKGVWETNSSSTHALCVNTQMPTSELPKEFIFCLEDFGWDDDVFKDSWAKGSYLHTLIRYDKNHADKTGYENDKKRIEEELAQYGIKTKWVEPDEEYWYSVDHGHHLMGFVDALLESPELLVEFLFNVRSFIATGNDNESDSVSAVSDFYDKFKEDKDYKCWWKGN